MYIHVPFCKQSCHYCDFHFSTTLKKKPAMVAAICEELRLRKNEISEELETIYFGGGTPSLLDAGDLEQIFDAIHTNYSVADDAEITLEANPDDLSPEKITMLSESPVNRLSIGVQSFFEEDLKLMNRAHTAQEAMACIGLAKERFTNLSIDLIYGIPGMSLERWKKNLDIVADLGIPHISSYALTVEPRTALQAMIKNGKITPADEDMVRDHYGLMIDTLEVCGYENYEFSNFGRPGFFSRNNTAYWFGKPYLGIGPSAHSFDGRTRKWNISNNALYLKSIEKGEVPCQEENLTKKDRYNEYVMTRLRTKWGVSLSEVEKDFGMESKIYLLQEAEKHIKNGFLKEKEGYLHVTRNGKFLIDGIAADLFLVDLNM